MKVVAGLSAPEDQIKKKLRGRNNEFIVQKKRRRTKRWLIL